MSPTLPSRAGPGGLGGARVVLASMANDVTCVGIRTLATVLKGQGASVRLVHLPSQGEVGPSTAPRWLAELDPLVEGATWFGLSVMSHDAPRAVPVSRHLRRRGRVPLVWGGPYPTIRPAAGADEADYVCVGDGEDYLVHLTEALLGGRAPELPPPGSPSRPVSASDLDAVPHLGLDDTWLLERGHLVPATLASWRGMLASNPASRDTGTVAYETVTSRGCPHTCTFCGSTALDNAHPETLFRRRSVSSVLTELARAKEVLPFITGVGFADDNFFARPLPELTEFCDRYGREVGLPFICIGSPRTITRDRMDRMVPAGLRRVKMGIQSGSEQTTRKLGRTSLNQTLERALDAIHAHAAATLPPRFDLLVDLPFETLEDRLDTLRLVRDLPRPFRLELNSLRLMEGTPLLDDARAEGWDSPDISVDFKEIHPRYTNLLLALCRAGSVPPALLDLLAAPALVRALDRGTPDRSIQALWGLARRARRARRAWRNTAPAPAG